MVSLNALWLPILLSAVIVFVASFLLHVVIPFHKNDYRKLPDEERVRDVLRSAGVTPGRGYHFPFASMRDMKSPEVLAKFNQGPVGFLTIFPSGRPAMGKYLAPWFGFCLLISICVAFVAGRTLGPGAEHHRLVHTALVTALVGYSVAQLYESIWRGQTWGVTLKYFIDGVIYSLLTALTFGALWPK